MAIKWITISRVIYILGDFKTVVWVDIHQIVTKWPTSYSIVYLSFFFSIYKLICSFKKKKKNILYRQTSYSSWLYMIFCITIMLSKRSVKISDIYPVFVEGKTNECKYFHEITNPVQAWAFQRPYHEILDSWSSP